jgi:GNAT superfamily N-acetyltransferase
MDMIETFMRWWNALAQRSGKLKFRTQREAAELCGAFKMRMAVLTPRYWKCEDGTKKWTVPRNKLPLDLAKVDIRPLSADCVVNRFSCARKPLDRFLKNKAEKAVRRYEHRVFCANINGSPNVIGYYALQIGTDSVADLPDATKDNYLKNYVAFPAVHLSFLAVDEQYQGQGLGKHLLMDGFYESGNHFRSRGSIRADLAIAWCSVNRFLWKYWI